jgi:hypothetical protein
MTDPSSRSLSLRRKQRPTEEGDGKVLTDGASPRSHAGDMKAILLPGKPLGRQCRDSTDRIPLDVANGIRLVLGAMLLAASPPD